MTVPLTSPGPNTRLAGARRDIESLKKRGCGPWFYIGEVGVDGIDTLLAGQEIIMPFQNGWTHQLGGKVPLRLRWLLGGGVEIVGSITGGTVNSVITTLDTLFFDSDYVVPYAGHDDAGNYRAWHITTSGDLTDGS